jgi:ABC-type uncharacterized transport system substrate-binding protein
VGADVAFRSGQNPRGHPRIIWVPIVAIQTIPSYVQWSHPYLCTCYRRFAGLAGAAALPVAAWGQQGERARRIGVLIGGAVDADDPDAKANIAAFLQVLQQLGWTDGRNVRIDYRWGAGNANNIRKHAAELVALAPDVILATGTVAMAPLLEATRTLPIVFTAVADPVGAGFVDSLARPGGNTTGFMQFEII